MPTWCQTIVRIHADPDTLARFRAFVRGVDDAGEPSELSLASGDLFDPPDAVRDREDELQVAIWRQRHWGCKAEPEHVRVQEFDGGIEYRFRTPYSPPSGWLKRISRAFPDAAFNLAGVDLAEQRIGVMYAQGLQVREMMFPVDPEDPTWGEQAREFLARMSAADLVPADFDAVR